MLYGLHKVLAGMKEEWQILCELLLLHVTSTSTKEQDEVRYHSNNP
jgi:hypothetical protein